MRYMAIVTRDGGLLVAEVVEATGCRAVAETREELGEVVANRLEDWLRTVLDAGHRPMMPRGKAPSLAEDEELMLVEIPAEIARRIDRRLYNYSWIGAYQAGFGSEHPQAVIERVAPDASDFEAVGIADCTMFRAERIENLPEFIVDVTDGWPRTHRGEGEVMPPPDQCVGWTEIEYSTGADSAAAVLSRGKPSRPVERG